MRIQLSCEHASRAVPREFAPLFGGKSAVLNSHRGWDPGTAGLADALTKRWGWPCQKGEVSRLLVELNRSEDHAQLWSEFSGMLPAETKDRILKTHYRPHRRKLRAAVREAQEVGEPVLHFSLHSFTPELNGCIRDVDAGILFDPRRTFESRVADALMESIEEAFPGARVKFNEPYRGSDDGLITWLRTLYADEWYAGVEIEINQAWIAAADWQWDRDAWVSLWGATVAQFS